MFIAFKMTAEFTLSTLTKTENEKSALGPINVEKTELGDYGHVFTNFSAPLHFFQFLFYDNIFFQTQKTT